MEAKNLYTWLSAFVEATAWIKVYPKLLIGGYDPTKFDYRRPWFAGTEGKKSDQQQNQTEARSAFPSGLSSGLLFFFYFHRPIDSTRRRVISAQLANH